MTGRTVRLSRFFQGGRRTLIVPMDHGTTSGPVKGLVSIREAVEAVASGGASGVVLHRGMVRQVYSGKPPAVPFFLHLSASTKHAPDPDRKVLVASVEEAVRLGADGVSIHVNLGAESEDLMLSDFHRVVADCERFGMPLLAMIYPRGKKLKDQYDAEAVAHCARLGAELGADVVKTNYTGSADSFRTVTCGAGVPVIVAGGPLMGSERELLAMVRDSLDSGGAGVSIGRNVFQHRNPTLMTRALARLIFDDESIDDAMRVLTSGSVAGGRVAGGRSR